MSKTRSLTLRYIKDLYNPKIDKKNLLGIIKRDSSIFTISDFLSKTNTHPIVKKYFYGDPFPQKLENFGAIYFPHKIDFEKEIGIAILNFLKYHKEINDITRIKLDFEKLFLQGKLEESEIKLEEVRIKYGYSLWYFENKFILEESIRGFEGNKDLLNTFNNNNKNILATIIIYFLSLRCENNISIANYQKQLEIFLNGLSNELTIFLNFKLNFLNKIESFDDLTEIIYSDCVFPIIDRYETFIKICQLVLSNKKYKNEKIVLTELLVKLVGKINDPLIENLFFGFGILKIINAKNINLEELADFENYTNGNYEKSAEISKTKYSEFPYELTYGEIYLKSQIYLNLNKFSIEADSKLLLEILSNLYNVFCQNDDYQKSLLKLKKIILTYENKAFAKQLYSIVEVETKKENGTIIEKLSLLNSFRLNPLLFKVLPTKDHEKDFFESLLRKKELNTLHLFAITESAQNEDDLKKLDTIIIPDYRKLFYSAKRLNKIGKNKEASIYYKTILDRFPEYPILYQEALDLALKTFYTLGDYNSFLELYVLNSFNKIKLKFVPDEIHIKIESLSFSEINKSIYLPIFYYLTNRGNHLINLTVRHFLRSYNCKIPTEIIEYKDEFNLVHLIFFLRNICTQEVLKYFTYFKGTRDILNERLGICRILLSLDKENENDYNQEIGIIAKNIVIIDGLREVDESKIFVDEKGLRTNELKEVKNNFDRYIAISEILAHKDIFLVDLNSLKKILANIKTATNDISESEKMEQATNLRFNYFKEIFLIIRDSFLFNSKYGLDTYLSTRIRHGTLLGQIRSKFQDNHLITQKNNEGKYFENQYWAEKILIENKEKQIQFQTYLSNFSDKIDTLTYELKNNLIQIRTEHKVSNGLFDYIYPDHLLMKMFSSEFEEIRDYDLFLEQTFKTLWKQTKNNLSIIREYIATSIKDQYNKYLEDLENELKSLDIESISFQALINTIISCKTNIIWEIDRVSAWFQIKETNVKDFSIDKAIDTSLEITNRISENVRIINVVKNIKSYSIIKGNNFISYFDLLRIFFDNITKYSGNNTEELKVSIIAEEIDRVMKIKITNNLKNTSKLHLQSIQNIFDEKKNDLNSPNWDMERIKREGNTGFYKAKKILLTDLQSEKNYFTFIINENNEIEICISINLN